MSSSRPRHVHALLALLVSAAVAVVGTHPGPAVAAPVAEESAQASTASSTETVSKRYSSYRYAWVDRFNLCLGVYMTSTVRATYERRAISQGVVSELRSPRIIDPAMQFTIKKRCDDNAAYKTFHRANKITYANYYYGYKCDYNPSFSVGAPWSVGAGVTPDCGSKRVAKYGETQGGARRAYRFNLDTDGYAFGWGQKDSTVEPGTVKLCTSVSGYFRLKDSVGAERATIIKKVRSPDACISK